MSDSKPKANTSESVKKSEGYREPGIRQVKTTAAFRAFNFELYAKPNTFVMAIGLLTMSGCVAYIAYMNVTAENKTYNALNEDGTFTKRQKNSRWD